MRLPRSVHHGYAPGNADFSLLYLVNDRGEHPQPFTLISKEDVEKGVWKFNPALCESFQIGEEYGQRHLLHYTKQLKREGSMISPYGLITACWGE